MMNGLSCSRVLFLAATGLLVSACKEEPASTAPASSASATTASSAAGAASAAVTGDTKPVVLDAKIDELVRAGGTCPVKDGTIETSCPARKAVQEYVIKNNNSPEIAATCGGILRDKDLAVRLTAAACIARLTTRQATTQLAAVLDAIEAETNPATADQLAYAADSADAITSKLDARVVKLIDKLAATPAGEGAASSLLHSLFPGSILGGDIKPTALADATVLAALARPKGSLLQSSFEMVKHVEDKAVVCAALGKAIREDAPEWWRGVGVMADIGAPCAGEAPHAAEVAFTILATRDEPVQPIMRLDDEIDLGPALRAKGAAALKAGEKAAPAWKKADFAKAAAQFAAPRKVPKKK